MIDTVSGQVPWTKLWHERLLSNPAFCALDAEAVGAYMWLRLLAGQTNNNGSMAFGSEKRMNAVQVRDFLRDVSRIPPRRTKVVLDRLSRAGVIKVSRAGVVTISGWKEDQARAADPAMRKRMSRARRFVAAFLRQLLEPMYVEDALDRITKSPEFVRLVELKSDKASILTCAEALLHSLNAGPGRPPVDVVVGCDMSHIGSVTCHREHRTQNTDHRTQKKSVIKSHTHKPHSQRPARDVEPRRGGGGDVVVDDVNVEEGGRPGPALSLLARRDVAPEVSETIEGWRRTLSPFEAADALLKGTWDRSHPRQMQINMLNKRWGECVAAFGETRGHSEWLDVLKELMTRMRVGEKIGSPPAYFQRMVRTALEKEP